MNKDINQLSTQLGAALLSKSAIVTTAESCTGGGVAQAITDVAGSSKWFHCGYITYANHAKQKTLGVSAEVLAAQGAVCETVVIEMARGAAREAQADYAIAISGVAGPTGGSSNKPVGTVWFACLGPQGVTTVKHQLAGDRNAVREQSVQISLQQLLHQVTE